MRSCSVPELSLWCVRNNQPAVAIKGCDQINIFLSQLKVQKNVPILFNPSGSNALGDDNDTALDTKLQQNLSSSLTPYKRKVNIRKFTS